MCLLYYIVLYHIILLLTVVNGVIWCYTLLSSCQRQKPATVPNPSLKTSTCFEDMSSVEHAFLSQRNTTFQNMANMEN